MVTLSRLSELGELSGPESRAATRYNATAVPTRLSENSQGRKYAFMLTVRLRPDPGAICGAAFEPRPCLCSELDKLTESTTTYCLLPSRSLMNLRKSLYSPRTTKWN